MKIRKGNEYIKPEPYIRTPDARAAMEEKQSLANLFRVIYVREKVSPETLKIRLLLKKISAFKIKDIRESKERLDRLNFKKRIIKRKQKISTKKSIGSTKTKKPTLQQLNHDVLVKCGYVPKTSSSKRQRLQRQINRSNLKLGSSNGLNCRERRLIKRMEEEKVDERYYLKLLQKVAV